MRARMLLTTALAGITLSAVPSGAVAKEPPNQNDPCSSFGKNTCDTLGKGFYQRYQYGIRWFGEYSGAVDGEAHTYCIDLRYWYPAKRYNFVETDAGEGFKNTDRRPVSVANQQRMAHALWNSGRSTDPQRQAALMLYVHSLMGDAAPGEVDPKAISPKVAGIFASISGQADRFRGPYKVETSVSDGLTVGRRGTAKIRILSATGNPMPRLSLALDANGASGLPKQVRTNSKGVAVVAFTPTTIAGVSVAVQSDEVASTLPKIFRPTAKGAARNGQRLAAPNSQRLTATIEEPVARGAARVTTTATPSKLLVGETVTDKVTIRNVPNDWTAAIPVSLYGPFRRLEDAKCEGEPAWTGSVNTKGPGVVTTPPATLTKPGVYTYQLLVPDDTNLAGGPTPCGEASESVRVEVQPRVRTVVSSASVRPGTEITDKVLIEGLTGESIAVNAFLYGPFASREAIKCDGVPIWSGTVAAPADGEYLTAPVAVTTPGYYTYRETIAQGDFTRPTETACGDVAETAVVVGAPKVTTQVSAQETRPGATITDQVVVTGLGVVTAQVQVELWGPFETLGAIVCSGTPLSTTPLTVNGDGTYTSTPVRLDRAGYYTFRESLAGSAANDASSTACGEASETTITRAVPRVTTIVSDEVVRPGSAIFDTIRVTGLGKTPATVELELFGPFATDDAIRCNVAPVWKGRVAVTGDGEFKSPSTRVEKAGLYAYRERLLGTEVVTPTTGECALVAETSLAAPVILTGKGADPAPMKRSLASDPAVTRVAIADLGVNAPVSAVGIDIAAGKLAVPDPINQVGWWSGGAAPGDAAGTVVLGGHVDSARAGRGAFFRLKDGRAGSLIRVTSADGRTRSYRITTVRTYVKTALPLGVWTTRGPRRLVLVTCGGPFLPAEGSYRDNVVVTAVPA